APVPESETGPSPPLGSDDPHVPAPVAHLVLDASEVGGQALGGLVGAVDEEQRAGRWRGRGRSDPAGPGRWRGPGRPACAFPGPGRRHVATIPMPGRPDPPKPTTRPGTYP